MTDLEYVMALCGVATLFGAAILAIEWFSSEPADWVVAVRMWLESRKK